MSAVRDAHPVAHRSAVDGLLDAIAAGTGRLDGVRRLVLDLAVRGLLTADVRAGGARQTSDGEHKVPFSLPPGWVWTRLDQCGDLSDGPFGSKLKGEHYIDESGYRVLRLGNIGLGEFKDLDRSYIRRGHFETLSSYHLAAEDLLVASLGNPSGRSCLVPPEALPAVNKADCFRVRVNRKQLIPRYLVCSLNSSVALERAEELNRGDTRGRITLAHLRGTPVPLPPLAEQKRIVAKVDQLMTLCDELEARQTKKRDTGTRLTKSALEALTTAEGPEEFDLAWKRVVENFDVIITNAEAVQVLRQTLIDLAVGGRLTKSSEWPTSTLSELVVDTRYGTSRKCDRDSSLTPVLRIPNVVGGKVSIDDLKYAAFPTSELDDLRLRTGDVLVVRSNGSRDLVGRCCIVDASAEGFAFAGYLIRLRLGPDVLPTWFCLSMQTSEVRRSIEGPARTTSGVHNVNTKELHALRIPVPSTHNQSATLARVEPLLSLVDALASQFIRLEERAIRLVDALARKAVT